MTTLSAFAFFCITSRSSREGVTEKIKDGQTITIDGDRAVVITEEEL